jgi:hypothetical protein
MAVFAACPSCGVKLSIPDHLLGKKVRCTSCKTIFEAKASTPEAPSPPVKESIRADLPTAPLEETPLDEAPLDEPDRGDRDREADYDEDDEGYDRERRRRRRRRRRRDEAPHRGGLILGLGIGSVATGVFGVCCCHILLGPVSLGLGGFAFFLGQGDLQQMTRGEMDSEGRGTTQAGYICGIVGLVLGVIDLVCFVGSLFLNFGPSFMNMRNW